MNANILRQKYLDFFKSKGHSIIKSSPIVPENDPSTLFTSSGMQPLIPYLMGEPHPEGKRIADIQKSLRSEDIEEVGDNRHTTCFEMLGNWSLGDYFKKEQLNWFWEFLTKEIRLDPQKLFVSVYNGNKKIGVDRDDVSVAIWKDIYKQVGITAKDINNAEQNGLQDGRIFYYPDDKNWWSRSGPPANMPVGEIGGPDSEVFYDMGKELNRHENSEWRDKPCHVNCDCGRFIEIGNSVFIEFKKTEKGFEPLPQKNVDFGGGLERIAMILQGKDNIFETDMYINSINKISELSGKTYRENIKAFEVIADHLKGATFIMGDDKGVAPSNVDQGYIVRRLIRRALRFGRILDINKDSWTKEIARIIIRDYCKTYPELDKNKEFIANNLDEEEAKFSKTLKRGLKEFDKISGNSISGKTAFDLYQTYGFPIEMTQELADEKNMKLDTRSYEQEVSKHQELSRTAAAGKFKGGLADSSKKTTMFHTTSHLMLEALRRVLGDHVHQKGSNINSDRLRFDFSHDKKLTDQEKEKIEAMVNEVIQKKLPVTMAEFTLDEARKYGAEGVFDSKYGEKVKVFTVGEGDAIFSREICGGPHVENTKEIEGVFKIKKEQSSSAGVRRIKAVLLNK